MKFRKWMSVCIVFVQCFGLSLGAVPAGNATKNIRPVRSQSLNKVDLKNQSEVETKSDQELFTKLSGIKTLNNLSQMIHSLTLSKADLAFFDEKVASQNANQVFDLKFKHKGLFRYEFNFDGIAGSLMPGENGANLKINHVDIKIEQGMTFQELYKKVEAAMPRQREARNLLQRISDEIVPNAHGFWQGVLVAAGLAGVAYLGWNGYESYLKAVSCREVYLAGKKCSDNSSLTFNEWPVPLTDGFKKLFESCEDADVKKAFYEKCQSFCDGFRTKYQIVFPGTCISESGESSESGTISPK